MNRIAVGLLTCALVVAVSQPVVAGPLNASWSNGLRLADEDGDVQIKFGGRLQADWVFQRGEEALTDEVGLLEDGTEYRRMRFYFGGTVNKVTEFKAQLDFAGGKVAAKDLYLGVKKVPGLGTVRIGQQYEPMGLSEMTSSKYMTFVERATPMAFTGSRQSGLLATNTVGPVMWAGMVSRNSDGFGVSVESGRYNVTGRLAAVAWEENDGENLLHVGVSGSQRNPSGDVVKHSARPENHLAPKFVSAEVMADAETVVGGEAALVMGPFSVQGEYLMSTADAMGGASDPTFSGWYGFVSWFPTGEHRPYKKSSGVFSRVKPKRNYDGKGGVGAIELAARMSSIDLNDAGVTGGRLDDLTFAVNWYLNPVFKIMANYVRADLDDVGVSHALLTRVQTDF